MTGLTIMFHPPLKKTPIKKSLMDSKAEYLSAVVRLIVVVIYLTLIALN